MDKNVSDYEKNCRDRKSLRACNLNDVQYVSSRCCVTNFSVDSIRFRLVLQFTKSQFIL